MSRFFRAKNDVESDSDSDSEPEVVPQRTAGNRFSAGYQHDDSDSGTFKIVSLLQGSSAVLLLLLFHRI